MNDNAQPLNAGTLLGYDRYRIVRLISSSDFGFVYEAEFVLMGIRVAIKEYFPHAYCMRDSSGAMVKPASLADKSLVDKNEEIFITEARRLYKMLHPNIVRVSDVFKELGTSYYVMEYLDGHSLQSIVENEGPLPEDRAIKYMHQLMDALQYVHSQNILHLDIKPDNIMIVGNDRVILVGFGISKKYEVKSAPEAFASVPSPYTPPEISSQKTTTPASDIYSLGTTLSFALTGIEPPNCVDLASSNASLPPLPQSISPLLRNAIGEMMQLSPIKRPRSIARTRHLLISSDIIPDLRPCAYGPPPIDLRDPYRPTIDDEQPNEKKSNKKAWIIAAAAVGGAAIIGGGALLLSDVANTDPTDIDEEDVIDIVEYGGPVDPIMYGDPYGDWDDPVYPDLDDL